MPCPRTSRRHPRRIDQPRLACPAAPGAEPIAELDGGQCDTRIFGARGRIDRRRAARPRRRSSRSPTFGELEPRRPSRRRVPARITRHASRSGLAAFVRLSGIELHDLETDMRPAGAIRRDVEHAAVGIGRVGADAQASCRLLQAGARRGLVASVSRPSSPKVRGSAIGGILLGLDRPPSRNNRCRPAPA